MTFGILTLGLGWGSPGGGEAPEPGPSDVFEAAVFEEDVFE